MVHCINYKVIIKKNNNNKKQKLPCHDCQISCGHQQFDEATIPKHHPQTFIQSLQIILQRKSILSIKSIKHYLKCIF